MVGLVAVAVGASARKQSQGNVLSALEYNAALGKLAEGHSVDYLTETAEARERVVSFAFENG